MISQTLDEKIGREELPVGWPWRFFLFSLLIAVTAVVAYAGLAFGYMPFLQSQIARQEENLEELGRVVPQKKQDELTGFYSQLVNLQGVVKSHAAVSPLFNIIESRTNTGVQYTLFEVRVPERKATLEGVAASYGIFAQQLHAFNLTPEIESMIVNDSNALEGRVKFRLSIIFKPALFIAL